MTYAEKKQKIKDLQRLIESNPDMAESLKLALAELEKAPAEDTLHIEHTYTNNIIVDRDIRNNITFVTEKSLPAFAKSLALKLETFNQMMEIFEQPENNDLSVDDLRRIVSILDTMLSIAEMRELVRKGKK